MMRGSVAIVDHSLLLAMQPSCAPLRHEIQPLPTGDRSRARQALSMSGDRRRDKASCTEKLAKLPCFVRSSDAIQSLRKLYATSQRLRKRANSQHAQGYGSPQSSATLYSIWRDALPNRTRRSSSIGRGAPPQSGTALLLNRARRSSLSVGATAPPRPWSIV